MPLFESIARSHVWFFIATNYDTILETFLSKTCVYGICDVRSSKGRGNILKGDNNNEMMYR